MEDNVAKTLLLQCRATDVFTRENYGRIIHANFANSSRVAFAKPFLLRSFHCERQSSLVGVLPTEDTVLL